MKNFILPMDTHNEGDREILGGKSTNLCRLFRCPGVRIPETWTMNAGALCFFIGESIGIGEFTALLKEYIDKNNRGGFFSRLAHIPFPEKLRREIAEKLPWDRYLIVRSSGTAEDSAGTSLAGHYESIISAPDINELLLTIKKCWLVGLRVYLDQIFKPSKPRRWKKIAFNALNSTGLLFQEVIDSKLSGVYFSQSPTDPGQAFVTANFGTCHSQVDGRMAGDYYIIKEDGTLESTIRYKYEMTVFQKDKSLLPGQTVDTPLGSTILHFPYADYIYSARIPGEYGCGSVLDRKKLEELTDTAEAVKSHMGYEIDMEWTFDVDGLCVLQVRPVTTPEPSVTTSIEEREYLCASPGVATGPVKIIHSPGDAHKVEQGDIIAVYATDPDYMPIIYKCSGIISEEGTPLCHTAIVARELKIPCVLGYEKAVGGAFIDGQIVTVDGDRGRVFTGYEQSSETVEKVFQRNNIIYDIIRLSSGETLKKPVVAVSAFIYDYFREYGWRDPVLSGLQEHICRLKKRYGSDEMAFYWDINDHENIFQEQDPFIQEFYRWLKEGGGLYERNQVW